MHGLINKALESFLTDTFGQPAWHGVLRRAGLWEQIGTDGFDSLHVYPDEMTTRLVSAAETGLGRPGESLLEDLGTYLVSHERTARLRRLLRFGGSSYTEFLQSLPDLQGRARLAVPALDLPAFTLDEFGPGRFRLICRGCAPGSGHVLLGLLRAMADDYGALVVLEHKGRLGEGETPAPAVPVAAPLPGGEWLTIELHDPAFHRGRSFDLGGLGAMA